MDGFLIIDKPSGMTSQTVCTKIKYAYKLNKVGHNGTLDPETTGVMVVALNRATKMLNYLTNEDKAYVTTIVFGYDSDTLDVFGTIKENIDMPVNMTDVNNALEIIKTWETQIPPMVSAIKVNGKKLMAYERTKEEVLVKERPAKILDLKVLSDLRLVDNHYEIDLLLYVTKGFYVRSFARDLGKLCGGIAIMKKLRRISAGNFKETEAMPLANVLDKLPIPLAIDQVFTYPKIEANSRILTFIKNGVTIYPHNLTKDCNYVDYAKLTRFYFTYEGKNIAIYEKQNDIFRPIFIF